MNASEPARRAEMILWAKDGAFNGDAGPTVFYHGTDAAEVFNIFGRADEASIGFHFGEARVANDRLRIIHRMEEDRDSHGLIIPVICRASAPLQIRDHFMWDQDSVANDLVDMGLITGSQAEVIIDACDEAYLFAAIEMAGFDCITYANECEYKEEVTTSLLIWRAEHLKSPFASSFCLADPRLLPQIDTSDLDMENWREMGQRIENAKESLAIPAPRAPAP